MFPNFGLYYDFYTDVYFDFFTLVDYVSSFVLVYFELFTYFVHVFVLTATD